MPAQTAAPDNLDLLISVAANCPSEVVADLLDAATDTGAVVEFERRDPEVFASVEWVVPTAIVLFIGRKFIDTFAEQAAKDLYPVVKEALLRVIRRCCGQGRVLNPRVVTSARFKASPREFDALTVFVLTPTGVVIRFRFPAGLPEHLHARALETLALMAQRFEPTPPTGTASDRDPVIFTFDSADEAWRQVDLLVEARAAAEWSKGAP